MAVITIPSSFSPIAAALDVFTQDRLAQQKRARQAEQDAWNREARNRQRQNWGYIDQERDYQQQQRDIAAQAQAEQEAKAASWTPDIGMTALTGMIPEQVATGRVHPNLPSRKSTQEELYNALETHQARWPGAAQISPSGIAKLYGPQQEALSFREFQETLAAARSSDPKQRDLAMYQLMIPKSEGGYGLSDYKIQQLLQGAEETFTPPTGTERDELARILYDPTARHEAPETMATEMYDEDPIEAGRAYTTEEKLQAIRDITGKEPNESAYRALYKPAKQAKPAKPLELSSVGESGLTQGAIKAAMEGMFDPRGEELSKIASVLQAGLQRYGGVGNLPLAGSQGSNLGTTGDITGATQDLIMRNMWQAAQILHSQNPTTSARAIFENLMENVGYGDRGVDVLGIEESMISPYKEGVMPIGLSDTMASYRAGIGEQGGPTLKSPQEIAADYQALLEFAQRHQ